MSAIIKSGSAGEHVRPFALVAPAPSIQVVRQDEERARQRNRIAALESEIKERDGMIAALRTDVERAREEGALQGREAGRTEAEDRQSARTAALQSALERCQSDISANLRSLERLSFLVAQECLDKIFGDRGTKAELVRRSVENQIGKIDRATLVGIEVSREDFPETCDLDEVVRRAGARSVAVSATDAPSGSCRMVLRLGNLEVGINQQWGTLRDMLTELALPEAQP